MPITAAVLYHTTFALHSNPVIVTRVGSPRTHTRAITASTASTATVRMSSPAARTRNKPFGVVPGDGNTIDSNVNAPRTIAVGMCERPVRSHRTNTATTPSAAMTTIRASSAPRSERTKPQLGRAGFDGRGAGAGAGGLVTEPFVCVCTRGTR